MRIGVSTSGSWCVRSLAALVVTVLVCACGGGASVHEVAEVGVAASCAGLTPSQELRHARLVFDGTMLAGPVAGVGSQRSLLSPARVRVSRYRKGRGPKIVSVQTAISRARHGLTEGEDGIHARPGQHWLIYSASRHQPLVTSICDGSRRENQAPLGMRRFSDASLSFDYPMSWHARRGRFSGTFSATLVSLSPQPLRAECPRHRVGHKTVVDCRSPVARLDSGSLYVSWTTNGTPTPVKLPGTPKRVDGQPAKRTVTHNSCGVGADQRITVTIPDRRAGASDHWLAMTACIRGPRIAAADQQVRDLLQSTDLR